ncbi:hypothetical protein WNY78_00755 [Psychroserpens sp. AS72]|uniref:hypothetical protein n=1 Tax=Psychroserpens sp. AS72 TaxID=3135775 RepID=UPI0031813E10
MKRFLFLAILMISTIVFAENSSTAEATFDAYEEATIHFHDGTSIRGFGKITYNSSIKFKTTEDGEPDTWTELMLKGITLHRELDDIDFLYVNVKNRSMMQLLEVIELGEISIFVNVSPSTQSTSTTFNNSTGLLNSTTTFQNPNYEFFLKKDNESEAIRLFGIINFRKKAIEFFKNCPQIVDRLNERKYKRGHIIEMVYYYNDYCAALD